MSRRAPASRCEARGRVSAAAPALLATCLLLAGDVRADRVITTDGRVVTPQKAREEGQGYRLIFEHGEIALADRSLVQVVEIEGDMSDYVPKDENEREKLEQGYVRFEGRWMSKPAYEAELESRFRKSRERLEFLREHSSFRDAWVEETRHFEIRTNTSPELLEYYAELLEAYYSLMDKRIGIKPTAAYRKKKMKVNIYRSRSEFHDYTQVSPGVAGFFSPTEDSLNFYHDYAEPAVSDWIALHECTHLLTFLIDQRYVSQIWLNEAVADYFGSSTITVDKRGKLEIEPGKLQLDRTLTVQQAIEDGDYIRLEDLFFLEKANFQAFEYAHAWSFVYFLHNYDDGEYQKGFKKFFKDIYSLAKGLETETARWIPPTYSGKRVTPEAIREHLLKRLGVKDLAELEKQWLDYIAAIDIDAPEALLKRGIRAAQSFDFEAAIEDLDAAIESGTNDPRAYAYRSMARSLRGQREGALEDIERALEIDPLNAQYHYSRSTLLLGGFALSFGASSIAASVESDDTDDETKALAKSEAGLAMELDPDNDRYQEWYHQIDA